MSEANRQRLIKKISDCNHMSKPDAKNAAVIRDKDGHWLFEIYTCGQTLETKDGQDYNKD